MNAPTPELLFDPVFQKAQRARHAAQSGAASPLRLEAERRLRERLQGLRVPPPALRLSCFDLQNVNDLEGDLRRIYDSLEPGGLFLGVLSGGESLSELRACLSEAEIALKGGASPRVAPMADLQTLSRLLPAAGFAHGVADRERVMLVYPDLFGLMRDLRGLGLTNALSARSRRFAPRALFTKAAAFYAERFPAPSSGGIRVTIDLFFLHGWKE